ncbi:Epoxide hydrolase [Penicillium digitatum PHI26]|uniref:Epoxide hydrolase n=2 Tax=Penicillium digitatum TaxID=36651 RepID=K9GDP7_PEND2|nr:Epoxide hydrolase [Penicillium digitatum Pd1]EKV19229.1 Epoxide hydrolase [Penicillium digitatum PHI26]EKV21189.1 Epoxide hydrolase [Penicillium digitatum Pd1]KAG0154133.1 hypothetical protein PDIDSM_1513 [Penicillium digitatum]
MSLLFSTPPSAATASLTPFKAVIPKAQLVELETLIKVAKLAPSTYENSQRDRRYGVTTDWLVTMRDQWLRSYHCFLEFLPMLQKFREEYTPETLPYHLIVPSLPGFTFSSGPPLDRNFGTGDVARVLDQLMIELGFRSGYVVQGGDIGSRIAIHLGVDHESCKAVHVNVVFMRKPDGMTDDHLNTSEIKGIERMTNFMALGSGYAAEHGTRPSTIGHVLSSNPMALLAWIGEKYLEWVDDPLAPEDILESVTLYWLTETFPRAIYAYRQNYPAPPIPVPNDPRWYIHKPFGYSSFPKELAPLPRSWIETTGDLVFWEQHPKGGHFAALEQPDELKADLVKFIDQVWPGVTGAE